MNLLIAIAVGGGIGSLLRHFVSAHAQALTGSSFPYGILAVNVLGGLLMGVIVELGALKLSYTPELRAFLTTGLLGGFTTFSAFSLDTALLIERGDWTGAAFYILGSVALSVGALFLGLWLIRSVA
jgi:fluoride exporter